MTKSMRHTSTKLLEQPGRVGATGSSCSVSLATHSRTTAQSRSENVRADAHENTATAPPSLAHRRRRRRFPSPSILPTHQTAQSTNSRFSLTSSSLHSRPVELPSPHHHHHHPATSATTSPHPASPRVRTTTLPTVPAMDMPALLKLLLPPP